jgi:cell wall-associated NlpC family hydrolase
VHTKRRPSGRVPRFISLRIVISASITVAVVLVTAVGASADPTIPEKRAQAQAIIAEVQQLDSDLSKSIEEYNFAAIELDQIDTEIVTNGRHLVAARKSLGVAQQRVAQRLRDLYINGSGDSTLEVILGASSLDEVIARLDAIERVSSQDGLILRSVKTYRKNVEEHRDRLQDARADQARIVEERASQKASIESRLAERQQLLASVKDEIVRLQAEERRRQAALEAQARSRLAAQRLAAQNAAEAASVASATLDTAVVAQAPPPDGSRASQVIAIAMQYLGIPYVWGGASPSQGFDCSGLTTYVFAQIGISLPHHAASQYGYGVPVSREDLQPADLVFFDGLGHMGMYIGGGQFIHAPHTGDVVKISSIYEDWYAARWVGARRIL